MPNNCWTNTNLKNHRIYFGFLATIFLSALPGTLLAQYAEIRENIKGFWNSFGEQDRVIVDVLQRQQRQRVQSGIPTRFSEYWESLVQWFQKLLVERLQSD